MVLRYGKIKFGCLIDPLNTVYLHRQFLLQSIFMNYIVLSRSSSFDKEIYVPLLCTHPVWNYSNEFHHFADTQNPYHWKHFIWPRKAGDPLTAVPLVPPSLGIRFNLAESVRPAVIGVSALPLCPIQSGIFDRRGWEACVQVCYNRADVISCLFSWDANDLAAKTDLQVWNPLKTVRSSYVQNRTPKVNVVYNHHDPYILL